MHCQRVNVGVKVYPSMRCDRQMVLFWVAVTLICSIRAGSQEPGSTRASGEALWNANVQFGQPSEMRRWRLTVAALDADLSPDGHVVAVTTQSGNIPPQVGEQVEISLEVWDYRQTKLVAKTRLTSHSLTFRPIPRVVRFTSDGSLLVVADGNTVRVLDASTLRLIRSIHTEVDPEWEVNSIETSSVGHLAIIISGGYEGAHVYAYDLDSGNPLFRWDPPRDTSHSISWKPDGTQVAVSASRPCSHMGEINVFNTNPWSRIRSLSAKNSISLTFSNERLYVVESGFCKGLFFGHHLGINVFDAKGLKRLDPILLHHEDVHDFVSFANGTLIAETGELKSEHDWLDGTTWGVATEVQITAWKDDTHSVIFTAKPFTTSSHGSVRKLRLSRTGKLIVLLDSQHLEFFEMP